MIGSTIAPLSRIPFPLDGPRLVGLGVAFSGFAATFAAAAGLLGSQPSVLQHCLKDDCAEEVYRSHSFECGSQRFDQRRVIHYRCDLGCKNLLESGA